MSVINLGGEGSSYCGYVPYELLPLLLQQVINRPKHSSSVRSLEESAVASHAHLYEVSSTFKPIIVSEEYLTMFAFKQH